MGPEDERFELPPRVCESDSPCSAVAPAVRQIKPLPLRTTTTLHDPNPSMPMKGHKRRLSGFDAEQPVKKSRILCVEPRRQTVSNPLPLGRIDLEEQSYEIDDWPSMFAIADPATYALPENSGPLEFDCTGWSRQVATEYMAPSLAGMCITCDLSLLWLTCTLSNRDGPFMRRSPQATVP